jgi:hypothetical protein
MLNTLIINEINQCHSFISNCCQKPQYWTSIERVDILKAYMEETGIGTML